MIPTLSQIFTALVAFAASYFFLLVLPEDSDD